MKNEKQILQEKIENLIGRRLPKAQEAYNTIVNEGKALSDYVVPLKRMSFYSGESLEKDVGMYLKMEDGLFKMNKHALGQLSGRYGVPVGYVNRILGTDWGRQMLMVILNTHTDNEVRDRLLVREVDGVVRGILSDSYKRLDSIKLMSSFLSSAQKFGAVPVDAHVDETRTFLEVIVPEVREVYTENNGMIYYVAGARLKNSDFGDGAVDGRFFMMNVTCLNGMTGKRVMREVHSGKRLNENLVMSERTMKLDTATTSSKLRDCIEHVFSPESIEFEMSKVVRASEKEINVREEVKKLPKLGFTQEEVGDVEDVLLQNREEHGLKGKKTLWSFTQALTAMAQFEKVDENRKRQIEKVAGNMIMG